MTNNQKIKKYKDTPFIDKLREESEGQTRLLWHHGYYDYPLDGLCLWNGEKCWYDKFEEIEVKTSYSDEQLLEVAELHQCAVSELSEDDRYIWELEVLYNVYRVPKETLEAMEWNHEFFKKHVGNHTEYNEEGCTCDGVLRPHSEHKKFYDHPEKLKKFELFTSSWELLGQFKY